MKRDLSIDAQQVYIGDSSTLTLALSKEEKADTLLSVFSPRQEKGADGQDTLLPQSLYLLFDNLSEDRSARVEFTCTIQEEEVGKGKKLTLVAPERIKSPTSPFDVQNPILNDLFRRLAPLQISFSSVDKLTTLTLSWQINVWDTPGSYTIEAFVANSNQSGEDYRDIRGNEQYRNDQVRKNYANKNDFGTLKLKVVEDSAEVVNVSLREAKREDTPDQLLWMLIRNRIIDFNRYRGFIDKVMCAQGVDDPQAAKAREDSKTRSLPFSRAASYSMLKFATEFYIMQEAGLVPPADLNDLLDISTDGSARIVSPGINARRLRGFNDEGRRTGRSNVSGINIAKLRDEYLEQLEGEGGRALPYFNIIRQKLSELPLKNITELNGSAYDACYGILQSKLLNPPLLELIWSYWHEEGGLVQTLNALSLRFQNVRRGVDRDPLANLAIDPLRPLGNLLWGYIEDERNRLTINRRNLEYQYEYGISLAKGLGVPVAVLAGSAKRIERYRRGSEVRVHTSPVSNLHAWAAWQALQNDRSQGDALRNQLYRNVGLFKQTLWPVATTGGWFPVQKLALPNATAVFSLYHQLRLQDIQSLLLANDQQPTVPELAFCIRADHTTAAILHTCRQIKAIIRENNSAYAKSRNLIHHEPFIDPKTNPPSQPKVGGFGQSVH